LLRLAAIATMTIEGVDKHSEVIAVASTVSTVPASQAARIERLIAEHKVEVERLRQQFGDPQEALSRFVTDRFEVQALVPDDRPAGHEDRAIWEDDDDLDAW